MAFFLCSHSVPLGQSPGTPTGQDDARLPAEAGAGWQSYHHYRRSVIVSTDSCFPQHQPETSLLPFTVHEWLYGESFWFNTSREKLSALNKQTAKEGEEEK